ncbi:MAG: type II toxin-antitoxin system Phd/YefM family antitoxin [Gemmatimonadaceae bacterium]
MSPARETIAISKFKATCLAVLERVRRTGRPIVVTRFGSPMAEVIPPSPPPRKGGWLGSMRHRGRIVGDIVAPVADERDWEVLR